MNAVLLTPIGPVNHPMSTPTLPLVEIRPATLNDVPEIAALVARFVASGDLLPRSADAIRMTIDTWVVGVLDGAIVAIGSLLVYTSGLAEVRSLAVLPEAQGYGFGRGIVDALTAQGRARGIPTLFALTRAVRFFERLGYTVTEKENFPEKIWHACRLCPVQDNCDETAVVRHLAPLEGK